MIVVTEPHVTELATRRNVRLLVNRLTKNKTCLSGPSVQIREEPRRELVPMASVPAAFVSPNLNVKSSCSNFLSLQSSCLAEDQPRRTTRTSSSHLSLVWPAPAPMRSVGAQQTFAELDMTSRFVITCALHDILCLLLVRLVTPDPCLDFYSFGDLCGCWYRSTHCYHWWVTWHYQKWLVFLCVSSNQTFIVLKHDSKACLFNLKCTVRTIYLGHFKISRLLLVLSKN